MSHSGQPAEAETALSRGIFYWSPFWLAIFLVLAASAVSYAVFSRYSSGIKQEELNRLSVIADVKVTEFLKWKREREEDANVFSHSPFFVRAMEKWLQLGAPPDEDRQMLIEQMKLTQNAYGYREVFLFDAQGKPVFPAPPDASPIGAHIRELVKQAIQTQAVLFLDIGSNDDPGSMGMAIPFLVVHGSKSKTVGAAYMGIDTSGFLFPSMKAAPSDYKNTELVLVRREGNDVLFLNIPAAGKSGGLLRQPLNQTKLPAAMAILGNQTKTEGIDYLGVPVFAAMRKIPDSDWFVVIKVAQEEVYAPLRLQAWQTSAAIALLMALTGLAVGMWWRNQRAQSIIAGQKRTENNLRATSAYTRSLIEASLDSFVTISPEGVITDVNKSTEKATGFLRSELIGTDFSDYFTEPDKAREGYRRVFDQSYVTDYPLALRHRDGHVTDVLYNASVYRNDAGQVLGVFAAARDITESKRAEEALNKAQLLLDETEKIGQVGGWEFQIDTGKLIWSKGIYAIHEVDINFELTIEKGINFYAPASRPIIELAVRRAIENGEAYDVELEIITAKGNLRNVHAMGNADLAHRRIYGFFQNITERKRNEEALRLHSAILGNLAEGVYLIRISDGVIVFTNPQFERMFGYESGELLGKHVSIVNAPSEKSPEATATEIMSELARTGGWKGEVQNIRKDGAAFWCYANVTTFDHPQYGQVVVAVHEDITERKTAEDTLRESEQKFRTLTEAMPQIVWITRPDGWNIYFNQQWVEYTGLSLEESYGHGWNIPFHPDDQQRSWDAWQHATQTDGVYSIECRLRRADGVYRWWLIRGVSLHDENGKTINWFGTCTDIEDIKQAEERTRLSQARFSTIFNQAPLGIALIDSFTGRFYEVNSRFAEIAGRTIAEMESINWMNITHPDDVQEDLDNMASMNAGKIPGFRMDKRYLRPDGSIVWISMTIAPLKGEQNVSPRHLCMIDNITGRKWMEAELKSERDNFRRILNAITDGIYVVNRNFDIEYINPALERDFGKVDGRKCYAYFHNRDEQCPWCKNEAVYNGDTVRWEWHSDKTGKTYDLLDTPILNPDGTTSKFEIFHDITERKLVEEALRESEDKFRYIFEHSPIGMSMSFLAGGLQVNHAFCEMLGYSEEELTHFRWQDITHPDDIEPTQKTLDPLMSGDRKLAHFTKRYLHKNGSVVWAEIVTSLRRDTEGKPLYFLTNILDITERKRVEEELRKYHERLEELVQERTADLEAANKELEAFSYSVSHDLRTPLRAIDGFSHILLDNYTARLDDEGKRLLNVVRDNTSRMGQLIDDILKFSRTSRLEMTFSEIDMGRLAHEVVEDLRPDGGKLQVEIEAIPPATGDRAMMRQVFVNLLSNAIKFSRSSEPATIKVGGSIEGDEAVYFVRDNGVGFDMQYADKLFGVFQRLHGVNEFEGTGIGLAIVKRIVTRHGGRVWAEGKLNEGTTIYFALPAKEKS